MRIKFLTIKMNLSVISTMNPIYFWLKSFYAKNGQQFDKYVWQETEYFPDPDLAERIAASTDILCISTYIWNVDIHNKILKRVRELRPDMIMIAGGPEAEEHWDHIDYVVYGDGELAFCKLLDSFYDDSIDKKQIPNLITKQFKSQHAVFKFTEWEPYSPFLDLQDEFLRDYGKFKQEQGIIENIRDTAKRAFHASVSYERARGCPYACSFCDWQQGLHNKVNRRINDWKPEIDFFYENDVYVRANDANIGIYEEDIEIFEYVAERSNELNKPQLIQPRNYAKMNKDRVWRLYELMLEIDPSYALKVSLQTIHDDVLKNIQRPDIPWPEQKAMIKRLQAQYPHATFTAELMLGLPGMTKDKIVDTYLEFADVPFFAPLAYEWILLKKSPAADENYRKRHNLKTSKTLIPSKNIPRDKFSPDYVIDNNLGYFIDMVYNDLELVLYQKALNTMYRDLSRKHTNLLNRGMVESYLNHFDIDSLVKRELQRHQEQFEENGFYIWGHMAHEEIKIYEATFAKHFQIL